MSRLNLLWAVLGAAAGFEAGASELNTLSNLRVVGTGEATQVVVTGSRAPTFTVFRLTEPDRLVVDLSSSDASAVKGHHEGKGAVTGVVASQFSDERSTVGRLLVGLDTASAYDVRAEGNNVVVTVRGASNTAPNAQAAADAPAEQPAVHAAPPAGPSPTEAQAEPDLAPKDSGSTAAAVPQAGAEPNVVATRLDERPVKSPAHRITALALSRHGLEVVADGELAKFELIELSSPPRLAVDLYGVKGRPRAPSGSGEVQRVRVGGHGDRVRLVLDMKGAMPRYSATRTAKGLRLALEGNAEAAAAPRAAEEPAIARASQEDPLVEIDGRPVELATSETAPLPVRAGPPRALVDVKDVTFDEEPGGGRVEIKLSGETAWKVERPDPRSAVLTLEGAKLPKRLERSLDTSALDTPVKMVSAFVVPGAAQRARVVVTGDGALEDKLTQTQGGLSWRLSVKGVKTEVVATTSKAAGFSTEATRYAESGAPQRARYVGRKVTFEFKDIDIHNLLRIIAEVSKKNIVVADDVTGKVTIRLRNVPWDQALELILRSKGLGKEDLGNIIRVAPLKTLEEEAKLREERKKSLARQEDLSVQLIPVNYATASEMQGRVKDVLSERGTVTVDTRTNVLIVRDISSGVSKARQLVQRLDTQTPQVLIESRIVEANTNFAKEIGVQWGGHAQMAPGTGNATGLIFPNTVAVRGGSSDEGNKGTANVPNFAVNLPAAVGAGSGGALGFVFGSAGGALALNLRLSAMENQGVVKTISAPKVTTLDNSMAKISQGVSIPFSQASAAGVNTTFIEARLSLEVTPHITADGSVLMSIKAENNQPDPANTGANGQPAIQRKEAQTQVLVRDGDTTVIGGIYVRRGSSSQAMVPFLGRIPLLGFFFKKEIELEARQELLIFLTPRILNRQTVAQSP